MAAARRDAMAEIKTHPKLYDNYIHDYVQAGAIPPSKSQFDNSQFAGNNRRVVYIQGIL